MSFCRHPQQARAFRRTNPTKCKRDVALNIRHGESDNFLNVLEFRQPKARYLTLPTETCKCRTWQGSRATFRRAMTAVEPLDCAETLVSSSSAWSTLVKTLSRTVVQLPTVRGFVSASSRASLSRSITASLTNCDTKWPECPWPSNTPTTAALYSGKMPCRDQGQ